jgi:hypothetical protein
VLFDPFEEELHAPAHPVQLGDSECGQCEVVRKENQPLACLGIVELDATQGCFETFARVKAREGHGLIADKPCGSIDRVRVATLCSEVRLGASDEKTAGVIQPGQSLEVDLGSVQPNSCSCRSDCSMKLRVI